MRAGVGVPQLQVGDHRDVIRDRRERAAGSATARRACPRRAESTRAMSRPSACRRSRGGATGRGRRRGQRGHRRDHRVQQRQRQRRPQAAQERPARQGLLRDDHCDLLIWNGVLLTIPTISDEKR